MGSNSGSEDIFPLKRRYIGISIISFNMLKYKRHIIKSRSRKRNVILHGFSLGYFEVFQVLAVLIAPVRVIYSMGQKKNYMNISIDLVFSVLAMICDENTLYII